MTGVEESIYSSRELIALPRAALDLGACVVERLSKWKGCTRLVLAAFLGLGIASAARAEPQLPPDRFDIDVLTAYRYGLNHDWAPASCFGRIFCPEDHRYSKRRDARSDDGAAY